VHVRMRLIDMQREGVAMPRRKFLERSWSLIHSETVSGSLRTIRRACHLIKVRWSDRLAESKPPRTAQLISSLWQASRHRTRWRTSRTSRRALL
jgi:hypothetical protein